MTVSPLKKLVLPATLVAGTVFCSLTIPLAMFSSEPVVIQLKQEQVFSGKLKDIAAPYIGMAAALSLGAGAASIAIAGWRHSSHKSGKIEDQLSDLQRQLQAKEQQLEAVLFSDARLAASGLNAFLEDEAPAAKPTPAAELSSQPAIKTDVPAAVSSFVPAQSNPIADASNQVAVQAAVSPLAPAQAFLSFTRTATSEAVVEAEPVAEVPNNISLKDLQEQLKQLMSKVETLQGVAVPQPAQYQMPQSVRTIDNAEHGSHRPHSKPTWIIQQVAS